MGPAQISAVGRLERRRVEHRHERRLAVGGVGVERAAVVDRDGLGGNRRLVGVEELVRETRQPHHCGEQQRGDGERAERARDPLARHDVETTCTAVGFCVVDDRADSVRDRGGIDGGHPENSLAAFADALALMQRSRPTCGCRATASLCSCRRGLRPQRGAVPGPRNVGRNAGPPRHPEPRRPLSGARYAIRAEYRREGTRAARPAIDVARDADACRRLWLVHSDLATLGDLRAYDTEVRLVHEAHPAEGATGTQSPMRVRELAARGIDTENRHWGSWTPAQVDAMHATTYWRSGRSSTRLTSSPTRRHVVWTRCTAIMSAHSWPR